MKSHLELLKELKVCKPMVTQSAVFVSMYINVLIFVKTKLLASLQG